MLHLSAMEGRGAVEVEAGLPNIGGKRHKGWKVVGTLGGAGCQGSVMVGGFTHWRHSSMGWSWAGGYRGHPGWNLPHTDIMSMDPDEALLRACRGVFWEPESIWAPRCALQSRFPFRGPWSHLSGR